MLIAFGVAILLAIFYFLAGLAFSWKKPIQDKVTVILMFGIMNNILVVVFSSEFFSPLEPTVAAAYCIPFFSFIIPLPNHASKVPKKTLISGSWLTVQVSSLVL